MSKEINGYPLTNEQNRATNRAIFKDNLKLIAFSGSGKTSTLMAISKYHPVKTTYIAFNSSIAKEARKEFPSNVDCRTAHSLAFEAILNNDAMMAKYRSANNGLRITNNEMMEALGDTELPPYLSEYQFTVAISNTIKEFCQSAEMEINGSHSLPSIHMVQPYIKPEALVYVREPLEEAANKIWQKICSPQDPLGVTHDAYLKMFQLRRPRLDCDLLLFDEAQDINPVVMDIVKRQPCQIILVGDPHQQIYGWRGSVDAMDSFDYPIVHLTKSFRFGPEIAATANRILSWKGEENKIEGLGPALKRFDATAQHAVLCRGNMQVFSETLDALSKGRSVHVIGGLSESIKLVESGYALMCGNLRLVKSKELKEFRSWDDLKEYSDAANDADLSRLLKFITKYGDKTLQATRKLSSIGSVAEEDADVIVSTAHKSKGREWDQVRLVNGFALPGAVDKKGNPIKVTVEDINLFYVATTRAKSSLSLTKEQKKSLKETVGVLPEIDEAMSVLG